jgi:hypothetical protein
VVDYLPWELGIDVQRHGVREEEYAEGDVADDEADGDSVKVGAGGEVDSEVDEFEGDGGEEAAG